MKFSKKKIFLKTYAHQFTCIYRWSVRMKKFQTASITKNRLDLLSNNRCFVEICKNPWEFVSFSKNVQTQSETCFKKASTLNFMLLS